jgi:hypothetical protein
LVAVIKRIGSIGNGKPAFTTWSEKFRPTHIIIPGLVIGLPNRIEVPVSENIFPISEYFFSILKDHFFEKNHCSSL